MIYCEWPGYFFMHLKHEIVANSNISLKNRDALLLILVMDISSVLMSVTFTKN